MTDNKHLDKLNSLFQRLKSSPIHSPTNHADQLNKTKYKNVQGVLNSIMDDMDKISDDRQQKLEQLTQRLTKLQSAISQDILKREEREQMLNSKIVKVQKSCFRLLDGFSKQRADMDKRLQSSIEGCLGEINSYRLKTQSQCTNAIKQIQSYIPELDELIREVENQGLLTKQILKKIYTQFIQQIEELRAMIAEQKEEREKEEEIIVARLEEVYHGVNKKISNLKSNREKSQKLLVDLLEKVIDKVKKELVGY